MQPLVDEGLFVQFYMGTVEDPVASRPAQEGGKGYPVFKDVPFVRIAIPGVKDELIDQPAWVDTSRYPKPLAHNIRFPAAWARFQAGEKEDAVSGMPLKQWAQVTRGQVEQLTQFNVRTVEQLASMVDTALAQLGPGYLALREKAKAFLEQANGTDALRAQVEQLQRQLAEVLNKGKEAVAEVADVAIRGAAALAPAPRRRRRSAGAGAAR